MKSAACIHACRSLKAIVEFNPTRLGRTVKKGISVAICLCLLISNLAYAKEAIIADGKTDTTISQDGFATNISTDPVVNQNAFNSFSRFNVDSGHTVNLYVPSGAANLLNLVHSERSSINGVLNSIQNGQIGGNVYFLNPYGLIVGSEGTLNVGSLTAISPTTGFMESFFDSPNNPKGLAVTQVLEGEVPLNASGLITVSGTINAIGGIRISGGDVENTGVITSGAVFAGTSPDFRDVVNTVGFESGSAMSTENGSIVITAHSDVINRGIIASNGGDALDANTIQIEAGNDLLVQSGKVLAQGKGDGSSGGDVTLQAGGRIEITGGALIDARGTVTGGDGDISLTAAQSDHVTTREAQAGTGIKIANAELKGKDISLKASADAQYELDGLPSLVLKNVDNRIGYSLEAAVALAEAAAASEIALENGSVLHATGDIVLQADAAATAKTEVKDTGTERLSISFLYGEINSKATVDVQDGAKITAS
ncbi:MAG: leukotoxin LktA family filamentous adhesin, partial [Firmicutes bacterium]|nr:leukotoxin LktA family filamentous adhesin [Bacillota bacterium]